MRIKILECIRQGQIGGGESHLLSLVENLDKEIFEPVVLSFTDGPMIDKLNEMGVKTYVIHTEKPFDISKWKQVKKLLQKEKIALVHAHGTRAASNVFQAARSLGLPVIYTVHGWSFHDDQNPVIKKIRIWSEKYLTSRMNANISVSESNQRTGSKYFDSFDSVVINNGIDQEKFNPTRKFKDVRTQLGITKEAILILFIARFTAHKQPLTLIRAFARAIQEAPGLKLLMVGDGDQKEEAIKMIKEAGLEKDIYLQPFRQDVPDVLAAADIFVLPSLWEGLPIGLLEAMSMGKAVIGTNVDGTSEVISENVNGLLTEPGNIQALAAAMVTLSRDESMRNRLGESAKATVTNRFNAAVMTREIEKIYSGLL